MLTHANKYKFPEKKFHDFFKKRRL